MAWRIDQAVVRGEIDNRRQGGVTGRIWFLGRDEPMTLELEGNAWRDLAGHCLRFSNPAPVKEEMQGLAPVQRGVVGDITAARKVKVPDCSMEEVLEHYQARTPFPWHWGNSLYLEWFSESNGRIVIESASYQLTLEGEAAWEMSEAEEGQQRKKNQRALEGFMERLLGCPPEKLLSQPDSADYEDEPPQSTAEAEADAEAARMDLLLDRIQARIEREGGAEADFEQIMEEERERLRRERGEPDPPPLTPEEEAEREAWIKEINAAADEVLADPDQNDWEDEEERHPLVLRCSDLAIRLQQEISEAGWLPENASEEHPLHEIAHGLMFAGAKLAGAFGMGSDEEWPPDPLFAGDVLVRLKKARGWLGDALGGLDAADQEELATGEWRANTRQEVTEILEEIHRYIAEVRAVLED